MHTHRIIVGENQTLPGFDDLFVSQTSSLHLSDMLGRMLMRSNSIETKGMRLWGSEAVKWDKLPWTP